MLQRNLSSGDSLWLSTQFAFQATYLAMMCYNFGLHSYEAKRHEQCVYWLKESYDLNKVGECCARETMVTIATTCSGADQGGGGR